MKRIIVIALIIMMVAALAACGGENMGSGNGEGTEVIAQSSSENQQGQVEVPEGTDQKATDFVVRLLKASNDSGKNTLISSYHDCKRCRWRDTEADGGSSWHAS